MGTPGRSTPTPNEGGALRLRAVRYRPRRARTHRGHPVEDLLYVYVCRRAPGGERRTLGRLSPIPRVSRRSGPPAPLPEDRARAWEELVRWVLHLIVFPDPRVQEGQYQNRLRWEGWERGLAPRPDPETLYDWRRDPATLARLRPQWLPAFQALARWIGPPRREDFAALYPNRYGDEGLSDRARRAWHDLRALAALP